MKKIVGIIAFFLFEIIIFSQGTQCICDSINYKCCDSIYYEKVDSLLKKINGSNKRNDRKTKIKNLYISPFSLCIHLNELLPKNSKDIHPHECDNLKTVGDCVDLLLKKLGLTKPEDPCDKKPKTDCAVKVLNFMFDIVDAASNEDDADKNIPVRNGASYMVRNQDGNEKYLAGIFGSVDIGKALSFLSDFLPSPYFKFGAKVFTDFQKNTIDAKQQDIFTFGVKPSLSILLSKKAVKPRFAALVTGAYSINYIDSIKSNKYSMFISFGTEYNKIGFWSFVLPRYELIGCRPNQDFELISCSYMPNFGIEFSKNRKLITNDFVSNTSMLVFKFNANVYLLQKVLKFGMDYQYRFNLEANISRALRKFEYLNYTFDLVLLGNEALSLHGIYEGVGLSFGLNYKEGSNPWAGFTKQIRRDWVIKFKF